MNKRSKAEEEEVTAMEERFWKLERQIRENEGLKKGVRLYSSLRKCESRAKVTRVEMGENPDEMTVL